MRTEKLKAVTVTDYQGGSEYYNAGAFGITSIEWGEVSGHMSMIDTVRVFKDGKLHSEHPFTSCVGVYFE